MAKLILTLVILGVLVMVVFDLLNLAPQLGPVFEILAAISGACVILIILGWPLLKRVFHSKRDESD